MLLTTKKEYPMREYTPERLRHLTLLAEKYPTALSAYSEIIRLEALLRLPKGTEHFMSDLHGEHEAFIHILNSASGVIREKIDRLLGDTTPPEERADLATLIYYPREKLPELKARQNDLDGWYQRVLLQLIDLCRLVSSKHTRRHVRAVMPKECGHILDELLHAHFEDHDKEQYYGEIIASMLRYGLADQYIIALCDVVKRLAVDRLHIVGDLFDRGPRPDMILERLYQYHDVDFQWGNHDIVWMGAASGQTACMATVLRISARYGNLDTLEEGYGINLIPLATFALKTYENSDCSVFSIKYGADYDVKDLKLDMMMHKAIAIIQFKLEGQLILAHPEYHMDDRLLLDKIDFEKGTVRIGDKEYEMLDSDFPTVDPKDPYRLTAEEEQVVERLRHAFVHCEKLQKHVRFLFAKGSMYKIFNSNLLYHGCVPMDEDGNFEQINVYGKLCSGKKLYEVLETYARKGYYSQDKEERRKGRDTLWYIWAGPKSPVFGKDKMATFERYFIADKETHKETKNAYYRLYDNEEILNKILREFGLDEHRSHIINGHVPVEIKRGETPIKCNGKLLIIDGGFSKAYQGKTGIAGYTLVANSHGMNLVEHRPFVSAEDAIRNETDMVSDNILIETAKRRILVADTDIGRELKESIGHLEKLLNAYRDGILIEKGI